jgi:hypothetical protein
MTFDEWINTVYYAVSYVSPVYDRVVKSHINKVLQGVFTRNVSEETLISPTVGLAKFCCCFVYSF